MAQYKYQNVTLSTLVTLLLSRLQQSPYFSAVEIRENINEAIRIYQLGTMRWKQRFAATTTQGQVFYDVTILPGTLDKNNNPLILMPLRVCFNGEPLFFSTISDLDADGHDWQIQTTFTVGAPDFPQLWGMEGINKMFMWPADGQGNNSLQLDCAVQAPIFPTDGTGDNQFLNLDSGEVTTLLDYAQHVSMIKRGPGRTTASMGKLKSFMRSIALANSFFSASSIFKKSYAAQTDRVTRPRLAGEQSGVPTSPRYR